MRPTGSAGAEVGNEVVLPAEWLAGNKQDYNAVSILFTKLYGSFSEGDAILHAASM